jgi:hypothetical protein
MSRKWQTGRRQELDKTVSTWGYGTQRWLAYCWEWLVGFKTQATSVTQATAVTAATSNNRDDSNSMTACNSKNASNSRNDGKKQPDGHYTLQRQNAENLKQIFPEKEFRGFSPNFHILVSVSELYILTMGLPFLLEEILYVDRSWEYINRSHTHECGNWGWGRAIPSKGIYKRNCRCSAVGTPAKEERFQK